MLVLSNLISNSNKGVCICGEVQKWLLKAGFFVSNQEDNFRKKMGITRVLKCSVENYQYSP